MASVYNKPKRNQLSTSYRPYYPTNPNEDVSYGIEDSQIVNESLYRETSVGKMLVDSLCRYVVGKGLTPMASPEQALLGWSDEQVKKFQKQAESYYRSIANKPSYDYYGKTAFPQQQRIIFKNIALMGDTLLHRGYRKTSSDEVFPYLQIISGRMVSQQFDQDTEKSAGGVILDSNGREIGYKVRTLVNYHDTGKYEKVARVNPKTHKVEFDLVQLDQSDPAIKRGIGILTPLRDDLLGLNKYKDNHLLQSAVETLFTAFITSQNETASNFKEKLMEIGAEEEQAERKMNLGAGAIIKLENGEDIKLVEHSARGDDYTAYVNTNIDMMASALGMNREVAMGDFNSSFSASRGSLSAAEKTFEILRAEFISKVCDPTWEQIIDFGIIKGEIDAPGYFDSETKKNAVLACTWVGVTKPQIDPTKEINALISAVQEGLVTKEFATRTLFGMDFDEVLSRRIDEFEAEKEAGLVQNDGVVDSSASNKSSNEEKSEEEKQDENEDKNTDKKDEEENGN